MIDFITKPVSDAVVVVEVAGRLSELEREYFFNCVGDLVDTGYSHVIIECHGLGYISSSGLATLLQARKRVHKDGGRIYLTHLGSTIAEVLELTKIGRLLSVYPTTEDALKTIETDGTPCME